jgi:hypothetical protein
MVGRLNIQQINEKQALRPIRNNNLEDFAVLVNSQINLLFGTQR